MISFKSHAGAELLDPVSWINPHCLLPTYAWE